MERIAVAGPWITEKEIQYVTDAVTNAWYTKANCYHERFEKAFTEHLGVRYAIALPSCTSAIHLSLLALGVGPGDEVIVPDVTWIASAAPINYVGATPVFADIDEQTWCISRSSIAANLTPKTKAIIAVDLYGSMPELDAITELAHAHGVAVIEDAAEAIGSIYKGRPAGSLGDTGVFSFHGSKTVTTGEGGLLATDREDLYRRALVLRDHGRPPGDNLFFNREVAYKYKMSSMQAALGLAQLERLEELIARKREIFSWYVEELGTVEGVKLNAEPPQTRNSYWMNTAIVEPRFGVTKVELKQRLSEQLIDTRPFFYPLSSLPAYAHLPAARLAAERNTISYRLSPYGINLPSSLALTRENVRYVCARLRECLGQ